VCRHKDFKKILDKNKILMYHTFNEEKSAIAERVNRTINEKLKVKFEIAQNHKWWGILPSIVKEYNERDIHRSIGTTPSQVTKANEEEIREKLFPLNKLKLSKPSFHLGDAVRIPCYKNLFGNKYKRNWTKEIFFITKIHFTDPITYCIQDANGEPILGHFYKQELLKTKITLS